MLSKEEFVNIIDTLRKYDEREEKLCKAMNEISPDFIVDFYPLSEYKTIIIRLLEKEMNAEQLDEVYGSDIQYFIYDLDYGIKWKPDSIIGKDGTSIDISTAEKLYDYLLANSGNGGDV